MTFIEKTFGYDMWPHSLIHLVSQVFVVSKFKESDEGLCDSRNPKQGGFIRFETLLELPAHSGIKLGVYYLAHQVAKLASNWAPII